MQSEITYDQPSAAPVPKVRAVAVSGAVVTALVLIAGMFGIQLPVDFKENVNAVVGGIVALVTLINFVAAYFKRDKKPAAAVQKIVTAR